MGSRRNTGNVMIELPFALWIFFFVFLYPMIDLATIGLRTTFLYAAAHAAAWEAARAHTFLTSADNQKPAVQLASDTANSVISLFGGVTIKSIQTTIITTSIGSYAATRQTTPLSAPADVSQNIYQIQVGVTAAVNPLILWKTGTASIPGLTAPMLLTFSDCQYCENTQGLDK